MMYKWMSVSLREGGKERKIDIMYVWMYVFHSVCLCVRALESV